jgi:hypothetical protein
MGWGNIFNFNLGDFNDQGSGAESNTVNSWVLMVSRWDNNSSKSMETITVQILVMVKFKMAFYKLLTS